MGGGIEGEKDDDFMPDLQETSPGQLPVVATTTQESVISITLPWKF